MSLLNQGFPQPTAGSVAVSVAQPVARSVTGSVNVPPAAPIIASVTISGGTLVGSVLSSSISYTQAPIPAGTVTYQWDRNGSPISGATSASYTLVEADAGAAITLDVSVTNSEGSDSATSNTINVLAAPVISGVPTISGTLFEGNTLTATAASVTGTPTPTRTWQWERDGTPISGATSQTYTLVSADGNADITVVQTETNSQGSDSAESAASTIEAAPVISGVPTISGTLFEGNVLTATAASVTGTPTPTTTWQWERDGAPISGATSATYTLVSADGNADITVVQTETNSQGSATAESAASTIEAAPVISGVPTISGTLFEGSTLTATAAPVTGTPTPTTTWQWERDGTPISGATSATYTLVSADGNTDITVVQTETNSRGTDSAESAASVIEAAPVITGVPTISGTLSEGNVLTATAAPVTGTPTPATTWQWERDGTPIIGATSATYTLVSADGNTDITVVQTETNSRGTDSAESAASTIEAAPVISGVPTISGTLFEGNVLTATAASVTGTPTPTRTWQWERDGTPISGATSQTYTLVSADGNSDITVVQTETNVQGSDTAESAASTIEAAPVITGVPTISGTPNLTETLTASAASVTGTPTPTRTWQWERDGTPISGATSSTYTIVEADLGTDVTVVQSETNSRGTDSAESAATTINTAPSISGVPTIAGTEEVGQTLTATAASVTGTPTPTTSWQWQRSADGSTGWADISGATSATYTLVSADEDEYVRAVQTETNVNGTDSAASAASGQIAPDAYAANGFSPDYVADFSAATNDYFRVAGSDSDFATAFTADSEGGGLATQNNSSGNLVWRPHNLALNSATPATQSITVVSGADYTVEITGSGSVALTGAGTGTVTAGNPVEITASTTTLTLTVTGSPSTMWAYRSDLGGMANNPDTGTSYVPTTSAARYLARRRHHRWDGSAWVPTILHEPVGPVTNSAPNSRDMTTWTTSLGSPNPTANETGIDGQANTAYTLTDNVTTGFEGLSLDIACPNDSNPAAVSIFIKKNATPTGYPAFAAGFRNGTTTISASYVLDPSDGTVAVAQPGTNVLVSDEDEYWRLTIVVTNNSTGNTTLRVQVYPAINSDGSGSFNPSATGSNVFDQLDVVLNASLPSSPIITTGTTQNRTADTLKGKAASFPWSTTAVSMAVKGRHNRVSGAAATLLARYEDADDSLELRVDSSNNAEAYAETGGSSQTASGGAVATGADAAYSLAMRYVAGSAIQVATGGTAGSEVTASVPATPPLSDNDVLILEGSGTGDVNGTVDRVIGWDEDIAEAGIEEATA